MSELYNCLYCYSPCTIEVIANKMFLNCPKCGRKEATKKLKERLEAKKKLER